MRVWGEVQKSKFRRCSLASELVQQLIDSGIHFGHKASRWNPKMKPYILGKRNTVHLINLRETVRGLMLAKKFVTQVVARNQDVLFVGTKRQAKTAIETHANRVGMHFVSERWLGGTLTNFRTIRSRLTRLEELERQEESGQLYLESKKTISRLTRERKKILRNLAGIRKMGKLPGVLVIIDSRHERNAVLEARKLKIPSVCLIDTDSDPDMVDIPIPGNDDAIRAIETVVATLADSVEEGKRGRPVEGEQVSPTAPSPRKRSRRPTTSQLAEDGEGVTGESEDSATAATSDSPEAPLAIAETASGSGPSKGQPA